MRGLIASALCCMFLLLLVLIQQGDSRNPVLGVNKRLVLPGNNGNHNGQTKTKNVPPGKTPPTTTASTSRATTTLTTKLTTPTTSSTTSRPTTFSKTKKPGPTQSTKNGWVQKTKTTPLAPTNTPTLSPSTTITSTKPTTGTTAKSTTTPPITFPTVKVIPPTTAMQSTLSTTVTGAAISTTTVSITPTLPGSTTTAAGATSAGGGTTTAVGGGQTTTAIGGAGTTAAGGAGTTTTAAGGAGTTTRAAGAGTTTTVLGGGSSTTAVGGGQITATTTSKATVTAATTRQTQATQPATTASPAAQAVCSQPANAGSKNCYCWGDPHCASFDGTWNHYQGTCKLHFASCSGPNLETFLIDTKSEPWIDHPTVSLINMVELTLGSVTVTLNQGGSVTVDGTTKTMNAGSTNWIFSFGAGSSATGCITADSYGQVNLRTSFGLSIEWAPGFPVSLNVIVPPAYQGMCSGLCGPWDNDPSNDLTPFNGQPLTEADTDAFGDSWKEDSTCVNAPGISSANPCTGANTTILTEAENECAPIKAPTGPFKNCFGFAGMARIAMGFYESCKYDVCAAMIAGQNPLPWSCQAKQTSACIDPFNFPTCCAFQPRLCNGPTCPTIFDVNNLG